MTPRQWAMLVDHFPLVGLRLVCQSLELRLPSPAELGRLADLAADGVHDPRSMPFTVPWTDQAPSERARSVVFHHWATLGQWTPQSWSLPFAVIWDGSVVGIQEIAGHDYAVTRECSTGSWLGQRHHRQGIGTLMRRVVVHLAFVGLGAQSVVSSAYVDNPASLRVSQKLGYGYDGVARHVVQGQLRISQRLRLDRDVWLAQPHPEVEIHGLTDCLPLFGCA